MAILASYLILLGLAPAILQRLVRSGDTHGRRSCSSLGCTTSAMSPESASLFSSGLEQLGYRNPSRSCGPETPLDSAQCSSRLRSSASLMRPRTWSRQAGSASVVASMSSLISRAISSL